MLLKSNKKIRTPSALRLSAISLAISASMFQVNAAQAAVIQVNSNIDSLVTNNNVCMLRDAIRSVNQGTLQGGCSIEPGTGSLGVDDQIVFDSSLSGDTILLDAENPLLFNDEGELDNSDDLTAELVTSAPVSIDASSLSEKLTIDGGGQTRIFVLGDSTVLDSLILTNGVGIGDNVRRDGAAILLSAEDGDVIEINNSIITNNSTDEDGGAIGFRVANRGGSLVINNSQITNNTAGRYGGGIRCENCSIFSPVSVEINDSVISGNSARRGGGMYLSDGVPPFDDLFLTINNSTFSNNQAIGDPSIGASTGSAMTLFRLGVTINSSSIVNNDSVGTSTDDRFPSVGAIFAAAVFPFEMNNSTVSGNSSTQSAAALHIAPRNAYTAHIRNSTFFNNTSGEGANDSAVDFQDPGITYVTNSIIAGSIGGNDCNNGPFYFVPDANTIVQDGSCALINTTPTSIRINGPETRTVDPMLAPLANNGGSTLTHAALPNSPVVDSGDPETCTDVDQVGTSRDARCDVGAIESPNSPETLFVIPTSDGKTVIFPL